MNLFNLGSKVICFLIMILKLAWFAYYNAKQRAMGLKYHQLALADQQRSMVLTSGR